MHSFASTLDKGPPEIAYNFFKTQDQLKTSLMAMNLSELTEFVSEQKLFYTIVSSWVKTRKETVVNDIMGLLMKKQANEHQAGRSKKQNFHWDEGCGVEMDRRSDYQRRAPCQNQMAVVFRNHFPSTCRPLMCFK